MGGIERNISRDIKTVYSSVDEHNSHKVVSAGSIPATRTITVRKNMCLNCDALDSKDALLTLLGKLMSKKYDITVEYVYAETVFPTKFKDV